MPRQTPMDGNPYGGGPGTGITFPSYYRPTPSLNNNNNYFPGTEELGKDEMRISFLGSTPMPPTRSQAGTCIMVELGNGKRFFFDFGSGCVRNIFAMQVPFQTVNDIFLTHLHVDHYADLPYLYCFAPWMGRWKPLRVHGPSGRTAKDGIKAMVAGMQAMTHWHTDSFNSFPIGDGYEVEVNEFDFRDDNGICYDQDGVTVRHWRRSHTKDGAVAYRLDWNGLSFVWTGDGLPDKLTEKYAAGVDVFVTELQPDLGTLNSLKFGVPPVMLNSTIDMAHTTHYEAGYLINQVKPRLGMITHLSLDEAIVPELLAGIRSHWKGLFQFGAPDVVVVNVTKDAIWTRRAALPESASPRMPSASEAAELFDLGPTNTAGTFPQSAPSHRGRSGAVRARSAHRPPPGLAAGAVPRALQKLSARLHDQRAADGLEQSESSFLRRLRLPFFRNGLAQAGQVPRMPDFDISTTAKATPLTVLTGFLGAGKTTLLNRLLSEDHGLRIAVLVNDFGALNIDAELVVGVDSDVVSLANGCVCCSVRDDLLQAIEQVLARPEQPEYVILEASGVADPAGIAITFANPALARAHSSGQHRLCRRCRSSVRGPRADGTQAASDCVRRSAAAEQGRSGRRPSLGPGAWHGWTTTSTVIACWKRRAVSCHWKSSWQRGGWMPFVNQRCTNTAATHHCVRPRAPTSCRRSHHERQFSTWSFQSAPAAVAGCITPCGCTPAKSYLSLQGRGVLPRTRT